VFEQRGSLTIVGSGIKAISHFTIESMMAIKAADVVFHVVADNITESWISENAKHHRSMVDFYIPGQHRRTTYEEMKNQIVDEVKRGKNVCAVFYGHPGIFVNPSHAALRELVDQGYPVTMQPGISAEDCLFADIGIDPATHGCCSIEATNFLIYERAIDTTMPLVMWQIGMVGDPTFTPEPAMRRVDALIEKLSRFYPASHNVCVYEAALYSVSKPRKEWRQLADVAKCEINGISTMYIPALKSAKYDSYFLQKLGLRIDEKLGLRREES
jgi:precorrin-3B methylase